ncbi:23S rRNA (adenine(2030)-N(6))-methyltransferase RlmJ [Oceanisphaera avium]|uniref:Ribosomal RNA large subunit methyltransferase J n=1 Tax=Oceanisphaera avium TaxID=1903694 RepID=A0A1Y0CXJ2_9GAMM|nr:23S rRNA (adenine(2030)-N(6))-methyltransferase RlmJ [Oceanisphaera avium]ART79978.1 23S rRNA (adenine(2030)-N(6))-methyltransferase RlmJ [Oceanisphaera avium]
MLSYRHGFHAGNHADVLKHAVQSLILEALSIKDKGFSYIDTHAGAGGYALAHEWTQKKSEYLTGIALLWQHREQWPELAGYFGAITAINETMQAPADTLDFYPGSPKVAEYFKRPQDSLTLMELHNNEVAQLRENMAPQGRRLAQHYSNRSKGPTIHHTDGFTGLIGLLPPTPKRGLVLIDPPYELKEDYQTLAETMAQAYKRWPIGIYAIWYPLLAKDVDRSASLKAALAQTGFDNILCAELSVRQQAQDFGMHGSGMMILNPPWKLDEQLKSLLPRLAETLGQDPSATGHLAWLKQSDK